MNYFMEHDEGPFSDDPVSFVSRPQYAFVSRPQYAFQAVFVFFR